MALSSKSSMLSRRRTLRRCITYLLVFTLVFCPVAVQKSQADEPVTIGVGTWIAVTGAAAVISWGVGKLLDAVFDTKKKTTMQRQVQLRLPNGTVITKTETKVVDPPLSDVDPVAITEYPRDWIVSTPPPLAGDRTTGTIVARIDTANERLIQDGDASALQVGASVVDLVHAEGAVAGNDSWVHVETVESHFRRPDGPNTDNSQFTFTPSGSIQLTTTSFPNQHATVGYSYSISADLVDTTGTLPMIPDFFTFEGGVEIDQDSVTHNVVGEEIPGTSYDVVKPGILEVTFSETDPVTFDVPDAYDHIELRVDTIYTGNSELFLVLGDFNLDGQVNGLDVDPFVALLVNGPFHVQADMNQDFAVDGLDVGLFVDSVVHGASLGRLVDASVPEPSSRTLFAMVLLGLVGYVRTRQRGQTVIPKG